MMDANKSTLNRRVNDFARRSFRDVADRDYIAARLACRAELMAQFLWSSQQAIEKYLKYILLINRVPAHKVKHDITAALTLTSRLPFALKLSEDSERFVNHIAEYGEYRYLDISYFVEGIVLFNLDKAIWEIRRYCQVLDETNPTFTAEEQEAIREAKARVILSSQSHPSDFEIPGGLLEQILAEKLHPARHGLIWQNAFFSSYARASVKIRSHFYASNAPLFLYPEILEELNKYVFIPRKLQDGYRAHLDEIIANPDKRP
jgi:HEPN domain-containing protein